MRVLVTGAGGFLGAHLVRGIADRFPQADILATDLAAEPDAVVAAHWNLPNAMVTYRELDVTKRAMVRSVIAAFAPSVVIHAAALTPTAREEIERPQRIAEVNAHATFAVLDVASTFPCVRRIIAMSSAAVFGTAPSANPLDEQTTPDPRTLYGTTKLAAETIAERLAARGAPIVIVRLASLYGWMERATASRSRTSHIHRLTTARHAAGPDVIRDWLHADDAATALALLIAVPSLRHGIYHLGGGEAVGWHRVLAAFRAAGHPVAWTDSGAADVTMTAEDARPVMCIKRIAGEIGFTPRGVEQGIAELVRGT